MQLQTVDISDLLTHENDDCFSCCALCGKYTKPGARRRHVLITWDNAAANPADEDKHGDNLGFLPVGSDCAKKLERAGVPGSWLLSDSDL